MKDVTVWIPTCKRPEYLRTALSSVRRQTALSSINEVVVVENGADRSSESVCGEFSELPITYIFRDLPLPPGTIANVEALQTLLTSRETEFLAVLFDDDWWMSTHLEDSLEALRIEAERAASFCPCMMTAGEASYISNIMGSFVPWFSAAGMEEGGYWLLSLADLIVASQVATCFHYSSMVVRKAVFLECLNAVKDGNPYDTDRIMSVEIGLYGRVVCNPNPSVFVRLHDNQELRRIGALGESQRWWNASSARILNIATQNGIDVHKEFLERMRSTGVGLEQLRRHSIHGSIDYLIQNRVIDSNMSRDSDPGVLNSVARHLLPPIILKAFLRVRERAHRNRKHRR